jgi:hypothetical protein
MKGADIVGLLAKFRLWWDDEVWVLFFQAERAGIDTEWAQGMSAASEYWQDLILLAFDNKSEPIEPYSQSIEKAKKQLGTYRRDWLGSMDKDGFCNAVFDYIRVLAELVLLWGIPQCDWNKP